MKATQKDRLIKHLAENESINPLTAWIDLGIYRLSDTIFRLRNDGYNIVTEKLIVKNKFGESCIVANYKLN
tara:strand:- start:19 stop:231 length:213 start_codon:yes stop_codon:yes gene_type:complete